MFPSVPCGSMVLVELIRLMDMGKSPVRKVPEPALEVEVLFGTRKGESPTFKIPVTVLIFTLATKEGMLSPLRFVFKYYKCYVVPATLESAA